VLTVCSACALIVTSLSGHCTVFALLLLEGPLLDLQVRFLQLMQRDGEGVDVVKNGSLEDRVGGLVAG
jgi:hypothetical protein